MILNVYTTQQKLLLPLPSLFLHHLMYLLLDYKLQEGRGFVNFIHCCITSVQNSVRQTQSRHENI